MEAGATATLMTLREIEGTLGSFVLNEEGAVWAQDLPAYFGSAAYDVGPRVLRLLETLAEAQEAPTHGSLRYGEHVLNWRQLRGGVLSVIAGAQTNPSVLRMAMRLVAKKLEALQLEISQVPLPPPTVRPPALEREMERAPAGPPEAGGARPGKSRALFFRGKRVK